MKDEFTLSCAQIEEVVVENNFIIDVFEGSQESFAADYLGHNSALHNRSTDEIVENYDERRNSYLNSLDIFVSRQLTVTP